MRQVQIHLHLIICWKFWSQADNILKSIRMIIPPAWQSAQIIDPDVRSFHEYNSMHMEPWDGPGYSNVRW